MEKNTSIILNSKQLLTDICGANDTNLHLIEELLQERVFYRGNELFLENGTPHKHDVLKKLVEEIEAHVHSGQIPDKEIIKTLYRSIVDNNNNIPQLLREIKIAVPNGFTTIYPRSYNQASFIKGMNDYDMTFCIGPAGTGKTFLAVAHALDEVLRKKRRKLILTRPVVEAGESLGYLPGDFAQKISPYLRPLYDAMETLITFETIKRMEENNIIEIAPLAYMRGRSLNNCYIILDEAQNTTKEQMKMFLTRIGENSKAIITGDITQIDLPKKNASGLLHAIDILGDIEEIYLCFLHSSDVVRNPLVKKIVQAYDAEEE